jgi:threonine 3-dehydrogenase
MMETRILLVKADAMEDGGRVLYRHPVVQVNRRVVGPVAAGHLRLRMAYAGICGTDLHLVSAHPGTGRPLTSAPVLIPEEGRVMGHEGIGEVLAVGAGVVGWSPGQWVVPASVLHCGDCPPCREGIPNQCRMARLLGLEFDGLFAEVADIPARMAVDVTEAAASDASRQALACLEPAATALHACMVAGAGRGDSVVVFGAGPIGGFAAMIAKSLLGCRRVTVVEPQAARRALVVPWCDDVCTPEEFAAERVPFDVLIEAGGALEAVNAAVKRINARGRVVLLARAGRPLVLHDVDHIISQAISVVGCRGQLGGYMEQMLQAFLSGGFPLGALVTRVHDGIGELAGRLREPAQLVAEDCKVLARFS